MTAATAGKEPGHETLLLMMQQLVLVREFETRCEEMWKAHVHMVGEFHLSLGQEAIAVGTCAAVRPSDLICPSIRGMGVYLCRGASLKDLMTTFFDRAGGIANGRWAHWHSPVPDAGVLAQTGMLGSGLVTSGGVALAGGGPTLIECKTYRFGGSTVRDPDLLRSAAEKEAARRHCPVQRFKQMLFERGLLVEDDYLSMVKAARGRIEEAERLVAQQPMLDASGDPLTEFWPYVEGASR